MMAIPFLLLGGLGAGAWAINKFTELDGEDVGEALADATEVIVDALPPIMSKLVPAIIEGIEAGVKSGREAIRGNETQWATALTVVLSSWAFLRILRGLTAPRLNFRSIPTIE